MNKGCNIDFTTVTQSALAIIVAASFTDIIRDVSKEMYPTDHKSAAMMRMLALIILVIIVLAVMENLGKSRKNNINSDDNNDSIVEYYNFFRPQ